MLMQNRSIAMPSAVLGSRLRRSRLLGDAVPGSSVAIGGTVVRL